MISKLYEKNGLKLDDIFKQPNEQAKSEYTLALATVKNQVDNDTSALMLHGEKEAQLRLEEQEKVNAFAAQQKKNDEDSPLESGENKKPNPHAG